jgi:hypothetical protein
VVLSQTPAWQEDGLALVRRELGLQRDRFDNAICAGLLHLLSSSKSEQLVAQAARVLVDGKQISAIPYLIQLLDHQDATVREVAAEGLKQLTMRDLGKNAAAWQEWWKDPDTHYSLTRGPLKWPVCILWSIAVCCAFLSAIWKTRKDRWTRKIATLSFVALVLAWISWGILNDQPLPGSVRINGTTLHYAHAGGWVRLASPTFYYVSIAVLIAPVPAIVILAAWSVLSRGKPCAR